MLALLVKGKRLPKSLEFMMAASQRKCLLPVVMMNLHPKSKILISYSPGIVGYPNL